jgi:hypothetical protein
MSGRAGLAASLRKEGGLWGLIAAPTVWAAHFLLSYVTAAVWCAKLKPAGGSLAPARLAVAAYTAAALGAIAVVGRRALRRHRSGGGLVPHDDDSAEDRSRFLGHATLLLAGMSAIAVVFAALAAVFVSDCR